MARRGATRASDPERRPTPAVAEAPVATARLEAALVGALGVGAALSGTILYIHAQLAATSGAYTSFCNVSARVNCDAVLTSAYGMLLGVPVALWALLTYLALAALVLVRGRVRPDAQARATLLLFAIALWSLVFSVYMAAIAAFALRTLCLLCSGLYLVNVAIAVLAWRLARSTTPGGPLTTRQLALGAGPAAHGGRDRGAAARVLQMVREPSHRRRPARRRARARSRRRRGDDRRVLRLRVRLLRQGVPR